MTPSMKKLCIFGLATGVGNMIVAQSDDDKEVFRAQKLSEAGQVAIHTFPAPSFDRCHDNGDTIFCI